MSDPRENGPPADTPPPEQRRRGVHPLIWVLLLIALAALGWWFYNRSVQGGLDTAAPAATAPIDGPAITSEQEAAAEAERERAAANERRRAERQAREREAARRPADREVEPIARVQPDYPPAAARVQEEGTVLVRVQVDAGGNATDVSIARRSGSRDLDRAALDAVRKWRFRPAIRDGKPVAAVAEVPVEFKLDRQ